MGGDGDQDHRHRARTGSWEWHGHRARPGKPGRLHPGRAGDRDEPGTPDGAARALRTPARLLPTAAVAGLDPEGTAPLVDRRAGRLPRRHDPDGDRDTQPDAPGAPGAAGPAVVARCALLRSPGRARRQPGRIRARIRDPALYGDGPPGQGLAPGALAGRRDHARRAGGTR
ncbi:hypothetical protein [Streptomyces yaizuensis]|uniref:Uncharacterized protein n=1 Tax=Streptomyces yaizuensis TaxID=2989713 RepID=A0ABQ5NSC4_9ACTN|nr:hypothetical protein [Streptomyces sp. YSPA8]GLF93054.1 hypothetical protein SYYSPA8_02175 [Streptomyces sp. YSPA8]